MTCGFVLITTFAGKEQDVFEALKAVDEISDIHPLFGEYDIIAKIEATTFQEIGMIVVNKVRTIKGIMDTKTLSGIDFGK